MMSAKPVSYIPQSPRLLDQLREVLRYKHYSLRTEEAYLYWVKFFVRWHGRNGQIRHPRDLGAAEVEQFLTMLTTQRNVSVSTHTCTKSVCNVPSSWLAQRRRFSSRCRFTPCATRQSAGCAGQTLMQRPRFVKRHRCSHNATCCCLV
jgi:hypothetical protein